MKVQVRKGNSRTLQSHAHSWHISFGEHSIYKLEINSFKIFSVCIPSGEAIVDF